MMDLSDTVIPKSDQLNAEDMLSGPRTVTITEVRAGSAEQPVEIVTAEFGPGRPFKPSKTVRRILIAAWGKEGSVYVGRRMTLYRDPNVKWAGQSIGGIRVSEMSDIDKPLNIPLTETRGKRVMWTVKPLEDTPEPASNPDAITPQQLRKLQTVYGELGITDRAKRLADASKVVGRDVPSANDLSKNEARVLIDDLERRASSHERPVQDVPLPGDDPGPDPWSTEATP